MKISSKILLNIVNRVILCFFIVLGIGKVTPKANAITLTQSEIETMRDLTKGSEEPSTLRTSGGNCPPLSIIADIHSMTLPSIYTGTELVLTSNPLALGDIKDREGTYSAFGRAYEIYNLLNNFTSLVAEIDTTNWQVNTLSTTNTFITEVIKSSSNLSPNSVVIRELGLYIRRAGNISTTNLFISTITASPGSAPRYIPLLNSILKTLRNTSIKITGGIFDEYSITPTANSIWKKIILDSDEGKYAKALWAILHMNSHGYNSSLVRKIAALDAESNKLDEDLKAVFHTSECLISTVLGNPEAHTPNVTGSQGTLFDQLLFLDPTNTTALSTISSNNHAIIKDKLQELILKIQNNPKNFPIDLIYKIVPETVPEVTDSFSIPTDISSTNPSLQECLNYFHSGKATTTDKTNIENYMITLLDNLIETLSTSVTTCCNTSSNLLEKIVTLVETRGYSAFAQSTNNEDNITIFKAIIEAFEAESTTSLPDLYQAIITALSSGEEPSDTENTPSSATPGSCEKFVEEFSKMSDFFTDFKNHFSTLALDQNEINYEFLLLLGEVTEKIKELNTKFGNTEIEHETKPGDTIIIKAGYCQTCHAEEDFMETIQATDTTLSNIKNILEEKKFLIHASFVANYVSVIQKIESSMYAICLNNIINSSKLLDFAGIINNDETWAVTNANNTTRENLLLDLQLIQDALSQVSDPTITAPPSEDEGEDTENNDDDTLQESYGKILIFSQNIIEKLNSLAEESKKHKNNLPTEVTTAFEKILSQIEITKTSIPNLLENSWSKDETIQGIISNIKELNFEIIAESITTIKNLAENISSEISCFNKIKQNLSNLSASIEIFTEELSHETELINEFSIAQNCISKPWCDTEYIINQIKPFLAFFNPENLEPTPEPTEPTEPTPEPTEPTKSLKKILDRIFEKFEILAGKMHVIAKTIREGEEKSCSWLVIFKNFHEINNLSATLCTILDSENRFLCEHEEYNELVDNLDNFSLKEQNVKNAITKGIEDIEKAICQKHNTLRSSISNLHSATYKIKDLASQISAIENYQEFSEIFSTLFINPSIEFNTENSDAVLFDNISTAFNQVLTPFSGKFTLHDPIINVEKTYFALSAEQLSETISWITDTITSFETIANNSELWQQHSLPDNPQISQNFYILQQIFDSIIYEFNEFLENNESQEKNISCSHCGDTLMLDDVYTSFEEKLVNVSSSLHNIYSIASRCNHCLALFHNEEDTQKPALIEILNSIDKAHFLFTLLSQKSSSEVTDFPTLISQIDGYFAELTTLINPELFDCRTASNILYNISTQINSIIEEIATKEEIDLESDNIEEENDFDTSSPCQQITEIINKIIAKIYILIEDLQDFQKLSWFVPSQTGYSQISLHNLKTFLDELNLYFKLDSSQQLTCPECEFIQTDTFELFSEYTQTFENSWLEKLNALGILNFVEIVKKIKEKTDLLENLTINEIEQNFQKIHSFILAITNKNFYEIIQIIKDYSVDYETFMFPTFSTATIQDSLTLEVAQNLYDSIDISLNLFKNKISYNDKNFLERISMYTPTWEAFNSFLEEKGTINSFQEKIEEIPNLFAAFYTYVSEMPDCCSGRIFWLEVIAENLETFCESELSSITLEKLETMLSTIVEHLTNQLENGNCLDSFDIHSDSNLKLIANAISEIVDIEPHTTPKRCEDLQSAWENVVAAIGSIKDKLIEEEEIDSIASNWPMEEGFFEKLTNIIANLKTIKEKLTEETLPQCLLCQLSYNNSENNFGGFLDKIIETFEEKLESLKDQCCEIRANKQYQVTQQILRIITEFITQTTNLNLFSKIPNTEEENESPKTIEEEEEEEEIEETTEEEKIDLFIGNAAKLYNLREYFSNWLTSSPHESINNFNDFLVELGKIWPNEPSTTINESEKETGCQKIFDYKTQISFSINTLTSHLSSLKTSISEALNRYPNPEIQTSLQNYIDFFEQISVSLDSTTANSCEEICANNFAIEFTMPAFSVLYTEMQGKISEIKSILGEIKNIPPTCCQEKLMTFYETSKLIEDITSLLEHLKQNYTTKKLTKSFLETKIKSIKIDGENLHTILTNLKANLLDFAKQYNDYTPLEEYVSTPSLEINSCKNLLTQYENYNSQITNFIAKISEFAGVLEVDQSVYLNQETINYLLELKHSITSNIFDLSYYTCIHCDSCNYHTAISLNFEEQNLALENAKTSFEEKFSSFIGSFENKCCYYDSLEINKIHHYLSEIIHTLQGINSENIVSLIESKNQSFDQNATNSPTKKIVDFLEFFNEKSFSSHEDHEIELENTVLNNFSFFMKDLSEILGTIFSSTPSVYSPPEKFNCTQKISDLGKIGECVNNLTEAIDNLTTSLDNKIYILCSNTIEFFSQIKLLLGKTKKKIKEWESFTCSYCSLPQGIENLQTIFVEKLSNAEESSQGLINKLQDKTCCNDLKNHCSNIINSFLEIGFYSEFFASIKKDKDLPEIERDNFTNGLYSIKDSFDSIKEYVENDELTLDNCLQLISLQTQGIANNIKDIVNFYEPLLEEFTPQSNDTDPCKILNFTMQELSDIFPAISASLIKLTEHNNKIPFFSEGIYENVKDIGNAIINIKGKLGEKIISSGGHHSECPSCEDISGIDNFINSIDAEIFITLAQNYRCSNFIPSLTLLKESTSTVSSILQEKYTVDLEKVEIAEQMVHINNTDLLDPIRDVIIEVQSNMPDIGDPSENHFTNTNIEKLSNIMHEIYDILDDTYYNITDTLPPQTGDPSDVEEAGEPVTPVGGESQSNSDFCSVYKNLITEAKDNIVSIFEKIEELRSWYCSTEFSINEKDQSTVVALKDLVDWIANLMQPDNDCSSCEETNTAVKAEITTPKEALATQWDSWLAIVSEPRCCSSILEKIKCIAENLESCAGNLPKPESITGKNSFDQILEVIKPDNEILAISDFLVEFSTCFKEDIIEFLVRDHDPHLFCIEETAEKFENVLAKLTSTKDILCGVAPLYKHSFFYPFEKYQNSESEVDIITKKADIAAYEASNANKNNFEKIRNYYSLIGLQLKKISNYLVSLHEKMKPENGMFLGYNKNIITAFYYFSTAFQNLKNSLQINDNSFCNSGNSLKEIPEATIIRDNLENIVMSTTEIAKTIEARIWEETSFAIREKVENWAKIYWVIQKIKTALANKLYTFNSDYSSGLILYLTKIKEETAKQVATLTQLKDFSENPNGEDPKLALFKMWCKFLGSDSSQDASPRAVIYQNIFEIAEKTFGLSLNIEEIPYYSFSDNYTLTGFVASLKNLPPLLFEIQNNLVGIFSTLPNIEGGVLTSNIVKSQITNIAEDISTIWSILENPTITLLVQFASESNEEQSIEMENTFLVNENSTLESTIEWGYKEISTTLKSIANIFSTTNCCNYYASLLPTRLLPYLKSSAITLETIKTKLPTLTLEEQEEKIQTLAINTFDLIQKTKNTCIELEELEYSDEKCNALLLNEPVMEIKLHFCDFWNSLNEIYESIEGSSLTAPSEIPVEAKQCQSLRIARQEIIETLQEIVSETNSINSFFRTEGMLNDPGPITIKFGEIKTELESLITIFENIKEKELCPICLENSDKDNEEKTMTTQFFVEEINNALTTLTSETSETHNFLQTVIPKPIRDEIIKIYNGSQKILNLFTELCDSEDKTPQETNDFFQKLNSILSITSANLPLYLLRETQTSVNNISLIAESFSLFGEINESHTLEGYPKEGYFNEERRDTLIEFLNETLEDFSEKINGLNDKTKNTLFSKYPSLIESVELTIEKLLEITNSLDEWPEHLVTFKSTLENLKESYELLLETLKNPTNEKEITKKLCYTNNSFYLIKFASSKLLEFVINDFQFGEKATKALVCLEQIKNSVPFFEEINSAWIELIENEAPIPSPFFSNFFTCMEEINIKLHTLATNFLDLVELKLEDIPDFDSNTLLSEIANNQEAIETILECINNYYEEIKENIATTAEALEEKTTSLRFHEEIINKISEIANMLNVTQEGLQTLAETLTDENQSLYNTSDIALKITELKEKTESTKELLQNVETNISAFEDSKEAEFAFKIHQRIDVLNSCFSEWRTGSTLEQAKNLFSEIISPLETMSNKFILTRAPQQHTKTCEDTRQDILMILDGIIEKVNEIKGDTNFSVTEENTINCKGLLETFQELINTALTTLSNHLSTSINTWLTPKYQRDNNLISNCETTIDNLSLTIYVTEPIVNTLKDFIERIKLPTCCQKMTEHSKTIFYNIDYLTTALQKIGEKDEIKVLSNLELLHLQSKLQELLQYFSTVVEKLDIINNPYCFYNEEYIDQLADLSITVEIIKDTILDIYSIFDNSEIILSHTFSAPWCDQRPEVIQKISNRFPALENYLSNINSLLSLEKGVQREYRKELAEILKNEMYDSITTLAYSFQNFRNRLTLVDNVCNNCSPNLINCAETICNSLNYTANSVRTIGNTLDLYKYQRVSEAVHKITQHIYWQNKMIEKIIDTSEINLSLVTENLEELASVFTSLRESWENFPMNIQDPDTNLEKIRNLMLDNLVPHFENMSKQLKIISNSDINVEEYEEIIYTQELLEQNYLTLKNEISNKIENIENLLTKAVNSKSRHENQYLKNIFLNSFEFYKWIYDNGDSFILELDETLDKAILPFVEIKTMHPLLEKLEFVFSGECCEGIKEGIYSLSTTQKSITQKIVNLCSKLFLEERNDTSKINQFLNFIQEIQTNYELLTALIQTINTSLENSTIKFCVSENFNKDTLYSMQTYATSINTKLEQICNLFEITEAEPFSLDSLANKIITSTLYYYPEIDSSLKILCSKLVEFSNKIEELNNWVNNAGNLCFIKDQEGELSNDILYFSIISDNVENFSGAINNYENKKCSVAIQKTKEIRSTILSLPSFQEIRFNNSTIEDAEVLFQKMRINIELIKTECEVLKINPSYSFNYIDALENINSFTQNIKNATDEYLTIHIENYTPSIPQSLPEDENTCCSDIILLELINSVLFEENGFESNISNWVTILEKPYDELKSNEICISNTCITELSEIITIFDNLESLFANTWDSCNHSNSTILQQAFTLTQSGFFNLKTKMEQIKIILETPTCCTLRYNNLRGIHISLCAVTKTINDVNNYLPAHGEIIAEEKLEEISNIVSQATTKIQNFGSLTNNLTIHNNLNCSMVELHKDLKLPILNFLNQFLSDIEKIFKKITETTPEQPTPIIKPNNCEISEVVSQKIKEEVENLNILLKTFIQKLRNADTYNYSVSLADSFSTFSNTFSDTRTILKTFIEETKAEDCKNCENLQTATNLKDSINLLENVEEQIIDLKALIDQKRGKKYSKAFNSLINNAQIAITYASLLLNESLEDLEKNKVNYLKIFITNFAEPIEKIAASLLNNPLNLIHSFPIIEDANQTLQSYIPILKNALINLDVGNLDFTIENPPIYDEALITTDRARLISLLNQLENKFKNKIINNPNNHIYVTKEWEDFVNALKSLYETNMTLTFTDFYLPPDSSLRINAIKNLYESIETFINKNKAINCCQNINDFKHFLNNKTLVLNNAISFYEIHYIENLGQEEAANLTNMLETMLTKSEELYEAVTIFDDVDEYNEKYICSAPFLNLQNAKEKFTNFFEAILNALVLFGRDNTFIPPIYQEDESCYLCSETESLTQTLLSSIISLSNSLKTMWNNFNLTPTRYYYQETADAFTRLCDSTAKILLKEWKNLMPSCSKCHIGTVIQNEEQIHVKLHEIENDMSNQSIEFNKHCCSKIVTILFSLGDSTTFIVKKLSEQIDHLTTNELRNFVSSVELQSNLINVVNEYKETSNEFNFAELFLPYSIPSSNEHNCQISNLQNTFENWSIFFEKLAYCVNSMQTPVFSTTTHPNLYRCENLPSAINYILSQSDTFLNTLQKLNNTNFVFEKVIDMQKFIAFFVDFFTPIVRFFDDFSKSIYTGLCTNCSDDDIKGVLLNCKEKVLNIENELKTLINTLHKCCKFTYAQEIAIQSHHLDRLEKVISKMDDSRESLINNFKATNLVNISPYLENLKTLWESLANTEDHPNCQIPNILATHKEISKLIDDFQKLITSNFSVTMPTAPQFKEDSIDNFQDIDLELNFEKRVQSLKAVYQTTENFCKNLKLLAQSTEKLNPFCTALEPIADKIQSLSYAQKEVYNHYKNNSLCTTIANCRECIDCNYCHCDNECSKEPTNTRKSIWNIYKTNLEIANILRNVAISGSKCCEEGLSSIFEYPTEVEKIGIYVEAFLKFAWNQETTENLQTLFNIIKEKFNELAKKTEQLTEQKLDILSQTNDSCIMKELEPNFKAIRDILYDFSIQIANLLEENNLTKPNLSQKVGLSKKCINFSKSLEQLISMINDKIIIPFGEIAELSSSITIQNSTQLQFVSDTTTEIEHFVIEFDKLKNSTGYICDVCNLTLTENCLHRVWEKLKELQDSSVSLYNKLLENICCQDLEAQLVPFRKNVWIITELSKFLQQTTFSEHTLTTITLQQTLDNISSKMNELGILINNYKEKRNELVLEGSTCVSSLGTSDLLPINTLIEDGIIPSLQTFLLQLGIPTTTDLTAPQTNITGSTCKKLQQHYIDIYTFWEDFNNNLSGFLENIKLQNLSANAGFIIAEPVIKLFNESKNIANAFSELLNNIKDKTTCKNCNNNNLEINFSTITNKSTVTSEIFGNFLAFLYDTQYTDISLALENFLNSFQKVVLEFSLIRLIGKDTETLISSEKFITLIDTFCYKLTQNNESLEIFIDFLKTPHTLNKENSDTIVGIIDANTNCHAELYNEISNIINQYPQNAVFIQIEREKNTTISLENKRLCIDQALSHFLNLILNFSEGVLGLRNSIAYRKTQNYGNELINCISQLKSTIYLEKAKIAELLETISRTEEENQTSEWNKNKLELAENYNKIDENFEELIQLLNTTVCSWPLVNSILQLAKELKNAQANLATFNQHEGIFSILNQDLFQNNINILVSNVIKLPEFLEDIKEILESNAGTQNCLSQIIANSILEKNATTIIQETTKNICVSWQVIPPTPVECIEEIYSIPAAVECVAEKIDLFAITFNCFVTKSFYIQNQTNITWESTIYDLTPSILKAKIIVEKIKDLLSNNTYCPTANSIKTLDLKNDTFNTEYLCKVFEDWYTISINSEKIAQLGNRISISNELYQKVQTITTENNNLLIETIFKPKYQASLPIIREDKEVRCAQNTLMHLVYQSYTLAVEINNHTFDQK